MIKNFLKRYSKKQWALAIIALMLLPFLVLFLLYWSIRLEWIASLPNLKDLETMEVPEGSNLYADDQSLIAKYYIENRINLTTETINPIFKEALIATEDVRFYNHNGTDFRSLMRVAIKTVMLRDRSSGGGSTLTQQLVKNTFKRERYKFARTLVNKLREIILAGKIEKIYTKDEILTLYINTVSFGERAFGLEVASNRFFSKPSSQLQLDEAATLVGMLKAPTYYSPRLRPDRAKLRRNVVLNQMLKYDYINSAEAGASKALPLSLNYQLPVSKMEYARYFKEQVKREFNEWSKDHKKADGTDFNLYRDGLKIYSSLDKNMQLKAENNMVSHMSKLQQAFIDDWSGKDMYGAGEYILKEHINNNPSYNALVKNGLSTAEALKRMGAKKEMKLWSWDGLKTGNYSSIDSIKHYLTMLHGSILAADPTTGLIKVWVGGNDFGRFQLDEVMSPRQVGSTFKPIVYLTALENNVDVCKRYKNELRAYSDYKDWTPRNADEQYGDSLNLFQALTKSVNTVSVQVLFDAGMNSVVDMAKNLGIENNISAVPSMVLGTNDISLRDMISAYAHFANRGFGTELSSIIKIEDRKGNVLYEHQETVTDSVASSENVDMLNSMLCSVVENGTARRLRYNYNIPTKIAGKTGTTQNQSDGWFIGFNPDLVIGAWVGTQDRRMHFASLRLGSGSNTALPLVGPVLEYAANAGVLHQYAEFGTHHMDDCLEQYKPKSVIEIGKDLKVKVNTEWMDRIKKNKEAKQQAEEQTQRERSRTSSSSNSTRTKKKKRIKIFDIFKKKK